MRNQVTDARRGFFMVDNVVVDDFHLTPFQMAVYVVIVRIADRATNKAFPSFTTIAKLASMSRAKTITTIAELEALGLISRTPRKKSDGKESTSNLYTVLDVAPKQDKPESDYAQGSLPGGLPPVVQDVDYGSPDGGPHVVHEVDTINTNMNKTKSTVAEGDDQSHEGDEDMQPDLVPPVVDDTSHRAVFGAVQEVWPDLDKARQGRITNQLRGQSHREADQEYDIKPPMNATEVRAFGRWYRDDGPAHLPTAPATIERWVRKFRAASTHQRYVRQAEALRNPSPPEPSAHELVMSSVLSAVEGAADGV